MIELWVILSIIAASLWAITSLINKFVLSHEMRDPILATIIDGANVFVLFIVASFIFGKGILIPFHLIIVSLLAGFFYVSSAYFYYSAVKKGEISRITSFLSISPIFVLIFAFLFLNERLTMLNYLGIILVVSGSFLISIKKDHSKYIFSAAFFVTIISALFIALRDLFFKFASLQIEVLSILFWIGVGSGLASLSLFVRHHPHVRKKSKQGIKHLILGRFIASVSLLIFFIAISLTSVSLVSALVKIEVLFVFIAATVLSYFHSKFIKEKINSMIIFQKLISIVLILAGIFFII